MEHPCHKCGHAVEDGTAFCAGCGAPQIRVTVAMPEVSAAASDSPGSNHPTAVLAVDRTHPSKTVDWPHGLQAAALAGLIGGFGMMFVGGLWMLAAGFLSIVFYRQRTRGGLLYARAGARLGAVTGVLGFAMFAFATVPTGVFRSTMLEVMRKYGSQRADPQLVALTERWMELLKTPEGLTIFLLGLLVFVIILSAFGGALGGALIRPRGRQGPFSP